MLILVFLRVRTGYENIKFSVFLGERNPEISPKDNDGRQVFTDCITTPSYKSMGISYGHSVRISDRNARDAEIIELFSQVSITT